MGPERALSVCAIVVTYRPDISLLAKVIHETSLQVGRVVVVDNGSEPGGVEAAARECDAAAIEILRLEANYGLGAAHNTGIEAARKQGARHVLILDQDSIPQAGMVRHLVTALARLESGGARICAVGPTYRDPITRHESYFVRLGTWNFKRSYCRSYGDGEAPDGTIAADFLISSGSLIPIAVLDEVGGMDEGLFIDHVDTDWYLRARARGYRAFGVCQAVMEHSLGTRTVRVRGLREHQVAVRPPLRLYYLVRNSLLLYRRPHVPFAMRLADGRRLLSLFFFFGMLVPPRLENLRMMLKGAWHGLKGVSGRYDDR